ncbi:MAG: NUDIX hydrolase [Candidatus Altiarchaeales archaeon]|nr:NUDIX hydrolase [Candidatus Altiarchaeota archaeon]MBU4342317.1 NUDIX hydrolase [Candidatus Altiarchaeota archaeon]MBU4437347.1 NUDIX hydrolase [Candidatus Altiarchaeota archaeon]MCG2782759.1 NUDIX hydrolase [Candidatus Altiarchaeales archaeon]
MTQKIPRLTVDAVILDREKNSIVLVKRGIYPFEGMWALPGGFVEYKETVENATIREAKEETGLDIEIERMVGVYSDPERDPRGHTVAVTFLCRRVGGELNAGDDAAEAKEFKIKEMPEMAFDHRKMVDDAMTL